MLECTAADENRPAEPAGGFFFYLSVCSADSSSNRDQMCYVQGVAPKVDRSSYPTRMLHLQDESAIPASSI